jgi:hypothetical protein
MLYCTRFSINSKMAASHLFAFRVDKAKGSISGSGTAEVTGVVMHLKVPVSAVVRKD